MSGTIVTPQTLSSVLFADGESLSGTFTATYNSTTGALQSVANNFSFTVTVGGKTVTLNSSDATIAVQTASYTNGPGTTPLYQIYISVNSGSAAYATVHNLYLDYTPNATALYTGTAPAQGSIESRYTSISDSTNNFGGAVKLTSTGGGVLTPESPACFMAGTRILTADGELAVEDLKTGTMVITKAGGAVPVRWLGRSTVSMRFADPLRALPIRIKAGAFAENQPLRDLLLSPDHAVLLGDILISAGALVNDASIVREADVPEIFTYYHVELASHELLIAEGVPAESFVDHVDRMSFDNWAEHEALGDAAPIEEMAYPRAKSQRQLPAALRECLAHRAAQLGYSLASNAA